MLESQMCNRFVQHICENPNGGVGKWLTPAVLKTVRPERVSWVRIPPPPPASHAVSLGSFFSSEEYEFAAYFSSFSRCLRAVICKALLRTNYGVVFLPIILRGP